MKGTRRCSSTTILITWAAVATSPTLTARYRSTSNMCRSVEVFIEERNKTRTKISWRMIVFNKKMMLFLKRQLISNRLSKGLADLLKEGITVN